MLPGSTRRAGSTGELTPLTLAEAGRVCATDLDGCRETTQIASSSWSRASRAAALAAVLAVGAIATLASGGFGGGVAVASVPLGAGRNHVYQVEETREAQASGLAPEVERPRIGEPEAEAEAENPAVNAEEDASDAKDGVEDAPVDEAVEKTVEEDDAFSEASVSSTEEIQNAGATEEAQESPAAEEEAAEKEATSESPSSLAMLGSFSPTATRYCAEAFTAPARVGSLEETRISITMKGILKYADRIYVLCTDMCDALVMPSELADKVTMVDGYAIDACGGYGDDIRHWEKASLAHKAAMQDAFDDASVNVIAILEQDTEGDPEVDWSASDWAALGAALEGERWNTLRMSYRPYDFEIGRAARLGEPGVACPAECACDVLADKLCVMRASGCAMQSSDAYFVHRRAVAAMEAQLGAKRVIDYHVFRDTPNQLFLAPAVARQTSYSYAPDFITVEDGKASVRAFLEKCRRVGSDGTE